MSEDLTQEDRTQDNRQMAITTVLGKDKLLFMKMSGTETLGRLFQYEIDVFSEGGEAIQAKQLLGTNCSVKLLLADGSTYRYFNGCISRFTFVSVSTNRAKVIYLYKLVMTPALWRLTRNATCRIFQQQMVTDIVKGIFSDYGLDVDSKLSGTYRTWEFCVQYRETDFNFVSRLMENEGIYYYFNHTSDGKHTIVLCDSPTSHSSITNYSTIKFAEPDTGNDDDCFVWNWEHESEQTSGQYELTDYNPLTSATSLLNTVQTQITDDTSVKGLYDYPGGYTTPSDGATYTRTRMEEVEAQYQVADAETLAKGLITGCTFTLEDHPAIPNVDYLITSMSCVLTNDDYGTNLGTGDEEAGYTSDMTLIPAKVQFRTPRLTPKPIIAGQQTAIVVGASGDEICTDSYGRIKLRFYWDLDAKGDDTSSCWIRVAQTWASKNWGAVFIPRVGMEVVVTFLEGDPDRPLVTGCVYNDANMPPYTLPDNKTQSGLKTRSTLSGTADTCNELRYEDKIGSEEIYFHAEKDFNRSVENNDNLTVGSSDSQHCPDGSQTISIYKDRTETVQTGNETVTISQGNRTHTIDKGDDTLNVNTGNRTMKICNDYSQEITQGNRTVKIDQGNDTYELSTGDRTSTIDTGNDTHEVKQGNRAVKIDLGNDALTISMGNQTTKLSLGQSSTDAMQGIELTCGSNSIKIDQTGITISGMMVSINGQVQTQIKGLMVSVQADAMLQAQGAITMIG